MLWSSLFSQPVGRLGEGMVLGLEGWDSDTVTYNIYQFKMFNVIERQSFIKMPLLEHTTVNA